MRKNIFLLAFIFAVASCATSQKFEVIIDGQERESINSVLVISEIAQDRIQFQQGKAINPFILKHFSYFDPGEVVPLFPSSFEKTEEERDELAKKVSKLNIKSKLHSTYKKAVSEQKWLQLVDFNILERGEQLDSNQLKNYLNNNAVLLLKTQYSFDKKLNSIYILVRAELYYGDKIIEKFKRPELRADSWLIAIQSPMREVEYLKYSQALKEEEIRKINVHYQNLINSATNERRRKFYKNRLRNSLSKARERDYIELLDNKKRGEWTEANIADYFEKSTENIGRILSFILDHNPNLDACVQIKKGAIYTSKNNGIADLPACSMDIQLAGNYELERFRNNLFVVTAKDEIFYIPRNSR